MIQLLPAWFSPGVVLILGGLLAAVLPRAFRNLVGLGAVAIGFTHLFAYGMPGFGEIGLYGVHGFLEAETAAVRIDRLGMIFAVVFHLAALLNVVYGWQQASRTEAAMGLVYAGAAVGGTLAGDLLTLFVYWELAALSSVFLVWQGGGHGAFKAGMRYLVVQVISGLLLLGGLAIQYAETQSLAFGSMVSPSGTLADLSPAALALLGAFGIKAAFPLVHTWLPDSYPRASAVGAVILSAFTTKLAIYALARSFGGLDILIVIGCIMAAFTTILALIQNDLRRTLSYSLNSQLGFMVCAIGIGTPLALNGAAAHAFVSVLYKGLLFMGVGAVLVQTGSAKASDLGGLHKSMPFTTAFTIVGAGSIAAVPLFSGFVAKSMITLGASEAHLIWPYVILLAASAGAVAHTALNIPYQAFFGTDRFAPSATGRPRPTEAPAGMLVGMALAAILCLGIGVAPDGLYALLPYEAEYTAYTAKHVVTQMQLVLLATLAFAGMAALGHLPGAKRATYLDADWLWRVPGRIGLMGAVAATAALWHRVWGGIQAGVGGTVKSAYATHGPEGRMARHWATGYTALMTGVVLGVVLIFAFFN